MSFPSASLALLPSREKVARIAGRMRGWGLIHPSGARPLAAWLAAPAAIAGAAAVGWGSAQDGSALWLSLGACLAAIVLNAELARRLLAKDAELARARRLAQHAELKALRAQLDPHFLFNALATVSALAADRRPDEAKALTDRLAGLCREMADMEEGQGGVGDEIDLAESYLAMAAVRFGDRLKTHVHIDPQALALQVPHLILQPLVENAVKHGVEPTEGDVEIRLAAYLDRGCLVLEVENRATVAPRVPRRPSRPGLGLANTRARLGLLFGERAELRTFAVEEGYRAQVRLAVNIPD